MMWVSTRGQYGLRALVEIAIGSGSDRPVSLKMIAERQGISQQYLEQLVSVIRKAGIVESVRGARGGYRLLKPMDKVTALEVIEMLEGTLAPVTCIEDEDNCNHVGNCATESLWWRVDEAIRNVLGNTTLEQLVAERMQVDLLQLEPLPKQFDSSAASS